MNKTRRALGSRRCLSLALLACVTGASTFMACSDDDANGPGPATDSGTDATKSDATTGSDGGGGSDSGKDATGKDSTTEDAETDAGLDAGDGGIVCATTPCAIHLAAGTDQACVILSDKTVRCWGANFTGESGQPLPADGGYGDWLHTPAAVPTLTNVRELSLGSGHSCALREDGAVLCWGSNQYGQLALPADGGDKNRSATPVVIPTTGTAANLSSGFFHACIRRDNGTAQCWGSNWTSQIGAVGIDSGLYSAILPTDTILKDIVQLDVGGRFGCGLLTDGGVSCFGDNSDHQLGRGDASPSKDPNPAPVVGLDASVARVGRSVGYSEGVVLADKTLRVWGSNESGNLGGALDASVLHSATPVPVPGISDAVDVSFGLWATCALKSDGTVWCWGTNDKGVTGLEPDAGQRHTTPVQIQGVTDAVQIAVGWDNFACALRRTGAVVCWGDNTYAQLGRGASGPAIKYDRQAAPVAF